MNIQTELDQRIQPRLLLKHPFYQAWEAGTLPVAALADYAQNYGALIAQLPQGWETLGDAETADEERHHRQLWQDFAASLNTSVQDAAASSIRPLVDQVGELFAAKPAAMG